jgi:hypothetical protein
MIGASRALEPAALSAADWEVVFQQTLLFADYQVRRLRWRGLVGGVLPQGFDPESIANQAIMDFLQQSPESASEHNPQASSSNPSSIVLLTKEEVLLTAEEEEALICGEPAPWPRDLSLFTSDEMLQSSSSPSELSPPPGLDLEPGLKPILWEVKRLVLRQVSRLHHLKENSLLSNEEDLARVRDQDGDPVSPLELIPAPDVPPDDALVRKESVIEYTKLKSRFEVFLAKERRLITLFELRCGGINKPQDLAARLKLGVRTVENLQKRLQRQWQAFSQRHKSELDAGRHQNTATLKYRNTEALNWHSQNRHSDIKIIQE